ESARPTAGTAGDRELHRRAHGARTATAHVARGSTHGAGLGQRPRTSRDLPAAAVAVPWSADQRLAREPGDALAGLVHRRGRALDCLGDDPGQLRPDRTWHAGASPTPRGLRPTRRSRGGSPRPTWPAGC